MELPKLNDIVSKVILPVMLGAIGFIVTDLLKQNEYKLERHKYAAEVLKNVYSSKEPEQILSYLEFAKYGIENSKSIFGNAEGDSLRDKLMLAIYKNFLTSHNQISQSKDSSKINASEMALSNYIDIIQSSSLEVKTNSVALINDIKKKDSALQIEKQMYEALFNNDYELTIQKSEELDQFFPQFHSAYEVGKTLRNAKKASSKNPQNKDAIMNEAKEKIKTEYSYGYKF